MNFLILGFGRTGKALKKYLDCRGLKSIVIDDYADGLPKTEDVIDSINTFDAILLSPGVPMDHPIIERAREADVDVIGDIEFAYREIKKDIPIVAVTGTNGKTTTTTLIGNLLKLSYNTFVGGNIGTPFIEAVPHSDELDIIVLEVSSFQLDKISTFKPHIALLLNITEDHSDYYGSFADYVKSKLRIFSNQGSDDWAIVGCPEYVERLRSKAILLGRDIFFKNGGLSLIYNGRNYFIPKDIVKLPGKHNLLNVGFSFAVSIILGVDPERAFEVIREFEGLPHRLEYIGSFNGISFYNDSKATNIDAVEKALDSFDSSIILLMGGRFKGGDLSKLIDPIKNKVKSLITFGEAGSLFADFYKSAVESIFAGDLRTAVRVAIEKASPGDTILLSPACSSFDSFSDYKERGKFFREEVMRWIGKSSS